MQKNIPRLPASTSIPYAYISVSPSHFCLFLSLSLSLHLRSLGEHVKNFWTSGEGCWVELNRDTSFVAPLRAAWTTPRPFEKPLRTLTSAIGFSFHHNPCDAAERMSLLEYIQGKRTREERERESWSLTVRIFLFVALTASKTFLRGLRFDWRRVGCVREGEGGVGGNIFKHTYMKLPLFFFFLLEHQHQHDEEEAVFFFSPWGTYTMEALVTSTWTVKGFS